jgi:hypothetical protein
MLIETDDVSIFKVISWSAFMLQISLKPEHVGDGLDVGRYNLANVTANHLFVNHQAADHQYMFVRFQLSL